ncbi:hypothetical protein C8Q80DRAFT_671364 [Daedaleopsis nitida]|nr:hypothetical protein C8Q80DRAFT_671364 [Daedaleopsis nitida]
MVQIQVHRRMLTSSLLVLHNSELLAVCVGAIARRSRSLALLANFRCGSDSTFANSGSPPCSRSDRYLSRHRHDEWHRCTSAIQSTVGQLQCSQDPRNDRL